MTKVIIHPRCEDCGHIGDRAFQRDDKGVLRDVLSPWVKWGEWGVDRDLAKCDRCGSRNLQMTTRLATSEPPVSLQRAPQRSVPWWQKYITEATWFKKLDDPRTRLGHFITTIVALAFAVLAFVQNPNQAHNCQLNPLRDVYNPSRLEVLGKCVTITGTVQQAGHERDGDTHIRFQTDAKWLAAGNARQGHDLVVEYLPSDPWPEPQVGQRLRLTCTWVKDLQHGGRINGWNECHPVWAVQPLGTAKYKLVP